MNTAQLVRPKDSEHAPYHAPYISLVPDGDIISILVAQLDELKELDAILDAGNSTCLHAPFTWTIRQVIGHCIDAERVFGYRMARTATGDKTPLAGFDENAFVANMNFADCTSSELIEEFGHVRQGNIALLSRIDDASADHVASVDDHRVTVRAFAYLLAGHLEHHLRIVRKRLA